jgi:DNA-binding XRE family transcriptional regulator
MVSLSSTSELLTALERAKNITFSAYVLRKGPVLDALKAACRRGAYVTVRAERQPYKIPHGAAENAHVLAGLRRRGADAESTRSLHLKGVVADNAVYLDDRNWANDGGDTIVRDDFADDVKSVRDAIRGSLDTPNRYFATTKEERTLTNVIPTYSPLPILISYSILNSRYNMLVNIGASFGGRLRELRVRRKLSQAALAERAGLTQAQVARIEGGKTDPRFSTMLALAHALGVDLAIGDPLSIRAARALEEPKQKPRFA